VSTHPTPADLARELGVSGVRIRGFLRERYPADAPGSGGLWALSASQVEVVRAYFRRDRRSVAPRAPVGAAMAGEPVAYQAAWHWEGAAWHWEGNVQEAVRQLLVREGWVILSTADAARRSRGDDIRAIRDGITLVVEVKGYPSTTYADPRRQGEVKRTNPSLQAKHWLAEAVLRSIRTLGTQPETTVAIALPEHPRYWALLGEIAGSLERLGITVIVVSRDDVLAAVPGTH
jgi:hypothetical protein